MSDDDIDFERVVSDPAYRRAVMAFLKAGEAISAETSEGNSDSVDQPRP